MTSQALVFSNTKMFKTTVSMYITQMKMTSYKIFSSCPSTRLPQNLTRKCIKWRRIGASSLTTNILGCYKGLNIVSKAMTPSFFASQQRIHLLALEHTLRMRYSAAIVSIGRVSAFCNLADIVHTGHPCIQKLTIDFLQCCLGLGGSLIIKGKKYKTSIFVTHFASQGAFCTKAPRR